MPALEERLTMVDVEPIGTESSGHLPTARDHTAAMYAKLRHHVVEHLGRPRRQVADDAFWSTAVAAMERFLERNVDAHPEAADCTAALTTPLGLLTDDSATAVLRQITQAHVFDHCSQGGTFGSPCSASRC
ncbi:hypothetical protein GCM10010329_34830 [Streptomyces spiroverticillatus]|uniref:Uncharacterized protein n=1 Tax=Streptomyces finlayi TaxID=67296 RepID=A0A918WX21_9ACTN|nr:hypothetical protein [Streptomyces finlayi]GHA09006.1 hypothetical protein GCM10010329_34830 [Streptomyces spiroverticillatus]GHC91813.1 hypothetical protein GCM10010334_27240 [Streptomyces finlayi]